MFIALTANDFAALAERHVVFRAFRLHAAPNGAGVLEEAIDMLLLRSKDPSITNTGDFSGKAPSSMLLMCVRRNPRPGNDMSAGSRRLDAGGQLCFEEPFPLSTANLRQI